VAEIAREPKHIGTKGESHKLHRISRGLLLTASRSRRLGFKRKSKNKEEELNKGLKEERGLTRLAYNQSQLASEGSSSNSLVTTIVSVPCRLTVLLRALTTPCTLQL
jgi:hypothetical protein